MSCLFIDGSDFSPVSVDVMFEDGEFSKTFRVNVIDDSVAEPLVEVFVAVVDSDSSNCSILIFVTDDDGENGFL
jgi:hypothetical protein